ncbi:MAG: tRNA (N(6)-L-threonylcarbamoyladenosine(37)-C(2))-methylthiotransferase MtaB [Lachnospiraceae bacterium]|nr:tRNA (N(6)-L-threonylcarbamoyladenosine(37)-C(2))-methylthiotransferase MtaB [Lachnospiraceae bacterium]
MKKKVALHNLGCKVNAYETEAMGQMFLGKGYEIVEFKEGADVYVINTCTVTNIADRKSRQMLHRAKKMNENALVVAVGCYAQAFSDDLEKDDAIDIIVGNDMKNDIVNIVENHIKKSVVDINDTKVKREFEELNIESMEEHTRAYIKIQDGCNQFCTYCIIPYARGRVRSRKSENIMSEVDRLINKGYQEIVLTGIHLSSYGIDFKETDIGLIDVIKMISERKEIKRIRLGSLEPRIITEEFMDELKKIDGFCPHFHLSLQSGSDETLKRMNRKYTSLEYLEGCNLIRKYYPNAAITTDVIVGFPGETNEEFLQCKKFLETVGFSSMHIFKYSKREGTKAAIMENQVSDDLKAKRSDELLKLDSDLRIEYMKKFIGEEIEVLFEKEIILEGKKYFVGHTKEYIKIAIETDENLENKILPVKVNKILDSENMLAIF